MFIYDKTGRKSAVEEKTSVLLLGSKSRRKKIYLFF